MIEKSEISKHFNMQKIGIHHSVGNNNIRYKRDPFADKKMRDTPSSCL